MCTSTRSDDQPTVSNAVSRARMNVGHERWSLLTPDMITMNQPPLTQHISIPKDMSQLSCEAFTAGVVEGVLDGLDVVSDMWRGKY